MDVNSIAQRLDAGESLKVKYRYPQDSGDATNTTVYGVRSDKLVDVSVKLKRFYTKFRGKTPVWIEADEVLHITTDDGIYEDFDTA